MRRNPQSGLTQLELLISLAIMAMIAVFLANTLDYSRQALTRSYLLSAETEQVLSRHRLRGWIEDLPLNYLGQTSNEFFEGKPQSLRFKSLVSDGTFRDTQASEFTILMVPVGDVTNIEIRGIGPHPNLDADLRITETLIGESKSFQITYFGRITGETEKRWHESWSDPTFLPDLVKLEWTNANGTPAPPLTLRPGNAERQRFMSPSSLIPPG